MSKQEFKDIDYMVLNDHLTHLHYLAIEVKRDIQKVQCNQVNENFEGKNKKSNLLKNILTVISSLREKINLFLLEEENNVNVVKNCIEEMANTIKAFRFRIHRLLHLNLLDEREVLFQRKKLRIQENESILKSWKEKLDDSNTSIFKFIEPKPIDKNFLSNESSIYIPPGHTLSSWIPFFQSISSIHPQGHTLYSWINICGSDKTCNKMMKLYYLINYLRNLETNLWFQRNLLLNQIDSMKDKNYTLDNYAYGTTPFHTWNKLWSTSHLQRAIKSCQATNKNYIVFGSSTGSLIFFMALSFDLQCIGYEILSHLFDISISLKNHLCIPNVEFNYQNMLNADVTSTGILFLTSQCWDSDLCHAVYRKLNKELCSDTIVIDYKEIPTIYNRFHLYDSIQGEVSWNTQQNIFIFHVR